MMNLIKKLRLDTMKGCSSNIWLAALMAFILLFSNFRTLWIPQWLLSVLSILILSFATISLVSYSYWFSKSWKYFLNRKPLEVLFLMGFILVTYVIIQFSLILF